MKQAAIRSHKKQAKLHLVDVRIPAVDMLLKDHEHVKSNFLMFKHATEEEKQQLLEDTLLSLVIHTKLEEEFIYSTMRGEEEELIGEAVEDHHVVDFVMTELKEMTPSDKGFDSKVKVLAELVKHHIKEEESELIPRFKRMNIDFDDLFTKMSDRREELERQYNVLTAIEPVELHSTEEEFHKTKSQAVASKRKPISTAKKSAGKTSKSATKSKSASKSKSGTKTSKSATEAGESGSKKASGKSKAAAKAKPASKPKKVASKTAASSAKTAEAKVKKSTAKAKKAGSRASTAANTRKSSTSRKTASKSR